MSDRFADYRVGVKPVLIGVAAGASVLVVALAAVYLVFSPFRSDTPETRLPPVAADSMSVQQRQAQRRAQLQRYGWVDREQGIVRIPIRRAMELVQRRYDPEKVDRAGGSP